MSDNVPTINDEQYDSLMNQLKKINERFDTHELKLRNISYGITLMFFVAAMVTWFVRG